MDKVTKLSGPCENTDTELFSVSDEDYALASCFMTKDKLLGINVGGYVMVKSLRAWHELGKMAGEKLTDLIQERHRLFEQARSKVDG